MRQMLKNRLKDQKGFTLIELLAVIVILGIIAAIAVPSILGLIGNSKKDAHVANVQQMISSAKMVVASEPAYQTGTKYLTLKALQDKNYLDKVESPEGTYVPGTFDPAAAASTSVDATVSYVKLIDGKIFGIQLITDATTDKKISIIRTAEEITAGTIITTKDIDRGDVVDQ